MTRYIRLKEWGCDVDVYKSPSEDQLNASDDLQNDQFRLRTDSDGFIVTGNDKMPTTRRVAILGGSIVENMFVHEEHRMCSVLERTLRETYGPIDILNGGVSGASTLHLINVLLNKVIPLRPIAVVLLSGAFDLTPMGLRRGFWSPDIYVTPIVEHENISGADGDYLETPDFEERQKLMMIFFNILHNFNIPLYFCTMGHRTDPNGKFFASHYGDLQAFERSISNFRQLNAQTRAMSEALNIPLVDLETELESQLGLFYDQFHLTQYGADVYARKLADFLGTHLFTSAS